MTALPHDVATDLRRENARLQAELRAARDRQNASAEILRAVAGAPGDVERLLQRIAEITERLFGASSVTIRTIEGEEWGRLIRVGDGSKRISQEVPEAQLRPGARNLASAVVLENRQIHIPDLDNVDPAIADWPGLRPARAAGIRVIVGTPLRWEGKAIGALMVQRDRPEPFTAEELALQQSFADQAVIAIENARLFDEVQAKTRDLSEALVYQTGSANILKVIASSPTDVGPVLKAIVDSACELCEAYDAVVLLKEGDDLHFSAHQGPIPAVLAKLRISRYSATGRSAIDRVPVHIHDLLSDEGAEFPEGQVHARRDGFRSILCVPLLREGESIGTIALRRTEVRPFSDKQIALLQTFADQAVIAIGNVRLFEEVQAKTRDLSEALTYQTGSGNILSVIASSPTDVGPVLKAIVESACELCEAYDATVLLRDGDDLRYSEHHGPIPIGLDKWPINRNYAAGRSVVDKVPVHVSDFLSAEASEFPEGQEMSRRQGHRCVLSVPLLREGESVGAIALRRLEAHPFSDKQIALLQTFADQAVIAIGNVRLFNEVQERTDDLRESLQFQTATSDVLKVISSSPDSLQPVLDVIVETSRHLCGTETSTIFLLRDEKFHIAAASGAMLEYLEFLRANPIALGQPGSSTSRAAREKRTVHIPDIGADPEFGQGPMAVGQRRALLSVPLMREGRAIGVITMRQSHLTPFTERQIEVVQTFADQAVIAISNVRLFEEVQARTRELSKSLDDLRTAQDRLIQTEKLASLGQLTAGIAHEIKNPLNFVNNFAALSAELTDELNQVLSPAPLDDKIREEVDEITHTLKDNLEKVVQHGNRADAIVKNMLLHSRQGSGEHRRVEINALVEESLDLAYHGARAEKQGFEITLERSFDPTAGEVDLFPQEITRVLLNLISNGFYAATKRKAEANGGDYEPTLAAATKNLGNSVEIRIRDNGAGIPPEVKEKMFNPFFTTKPAGEGTGLGLSISHDIIVKQHGGSIEVDTLPGEFTEFRIVLPRGAAAIAKSGERASR
jgi:GAF domain-containing protein